MSKVLQRELDLHLLRILDKNGGFIKHYQDKGKLCSNSYTDCSLTSLKFVNKLHGLVYRSSNTVFRLTKPASFIFFKYNLWHLKSAADLHLYLQHLKDLLDRCLPIKSKC